MVKQKSVTGFSGVLSQDLASILLLKVFDQLFVHNTSTVANFP